MEYIADKVRLKRKDEQSGAGRGAQGDTTPMSPPSSTRVFSSNVGVTSPSPPPLSPQIITR